MAGTDCLHDTSRNIVLASARVGLINRVELTATARDLNGD